MGPCVACPSGTCAMLASGRPDSKLYFSASIGPVARRIRHRSTEPGIAVASPAGAICPYAARYNWKADYALPCPRLPFAAFFRTCATKQECSYPLVLRHAVCLLRVVIGGYFEFRFQCPDLATGQDKASVVHRTHCAVTALSLTSNYKIS
jgi:hypothetical protein